MGFHAPIQCNPKIRQIVDVRTCALIENNDSWASMHLVIVGSPTQKDLSKLAIWPFGSNPTRTGVSKLSIWILGWQGMACYWDESLVNEKENHSTCKPVHLCKPATSISLFP